MISKKLHVFEILVRQNEAMLLAYILSCVEDRQLAEDIAQETFLVAYRRIETLRKPEAFSAWLRGIARWKLMEALRREPRNVPLTPESFDEVEAAFLAFEERLAAEDWEERFRVVEACLRELPIKIGEVCRLHYFEGLKARQIAAALQIDLNAVLKRLERAREAIRECVRRKLSLQPL